MNGFKEHVREGLHQTKDMLGLVWNRVGATSCLVGVSAGLAVYWLIKKNRYHLPPGPVALPLIGNYSLLGVSRLHETCARLSDRYGPVITIHIGPMKMVVLNTIEATKEAMVTKGADFANRPVTPFVLELSDGGKNIFLSQYTPTWKLHRKIGNKALRNYLRCEKQEIAVHSSMAELITLLTATEGKPFTPHDYIDHALFNLMCGLCFKEVYKFNDKPFRHFMDVQNEFIKEFGLGLREDVFPILATIWPSKRYQNAIKRMRELQMFIFDRFQEHVDTFDIDNIRDITDFVIMARKETEGEENAELSAQLTDRYLRQIVIDIFFAGFDTSRFTLTWGLLYLAGHPEVQKRAQLEIDEVVGRARLPTIKDRPSLPYTEAVLHEVMRIATVAPLGIPHAARVDSTICGYDIPKGTTVAINHWSLHNDPRHWHEPQKFNPERFLTSEGTLIPTPDSWLPFSVGRRVCMGEFASKSELILALSIILHQFKINLPPGVAADYSPETSGITGYTANRYVIQAEKRK